MGKGDLSVVSLFSGALGLDLGLESAGFKIRVAVDCNRFAVETIRQNRPDVPAIDRAIERIPTAEILRVAGLKVGEPTLVTGGPSCQAFSTAGQRRSIRDPRGVMFREFLRVVREARPRFFVMENVRGVLSAAVRHRPLKKRGPGFPPITAEEELGSALKVILRELKRLNYYVVFNLLNTADYGVPQTRERVLFIGSRDGEPFEFPLATHACDPVDGQFPWVALREGLKGLKDASPSYVKLLETQKRYLRLVPEGGNWRDLPPHLQWRALGKAHKSWGGRVGFFRRLTWERPAPALTTRPNSKATMLCHPTRLRPLSVREYARLQQFPDTWEFAGGAPQQYVQIGNAVPVGLGSVIGRAIRQAMGGRRRRSRLGTIVCKNHDFLNRLANRPATVLNPVRMRRVKSKKALKAWLNEIRDSRAGILLYFARNGNGNGRKPKGKAQLEGKTAKPSARGSSLGAARRK